MKPLKPLGILAGLLLALSASTASADLVFNLDTDNLGLTGPYATVDVHATSTTTATVTFTSLTNGGFTYLMGDGGTVGVNGLFSITGATASNSGTGFVATSLAFGTCSIGSEGCLVDGGSGNLDGFGSFTDTLNTHDGFTDAWNSVTLFLTADAGTTWLLDGSNVLVDNANNYLAGAHIYVTSAPADASNGASLTGFAVGTNTPVVDCPDGFELINGRCVIIEERIPEPGSLALLGLGLASLVAIRRRRFPV